MEYLKKAISESAVADEDERIRATVKSMLQRIEQQGEVAVREMAKQFEIYDQKHYA